MAQVRSFNDGVRELRTRVEFSKRRAEAGVTDLRSADEKVAEAYRLMGLVGQLLVEATALHERGATALKTGANELEVFR